MISPKIVPCQKCARENDSLNARVAELERRIKSYEDALTPSMDTKYAWSYQFFYDAEVFDEDGINHTEKRLVGWTTVKEIMKAIRSKANA